MDASETTAQQGGFPWLRAAVLWGVLCALLLLTNLPQVLGRQFPDPDDTLRLVEVRDWLGGQGWFDVVQHRIDPPHGAAMHWSRLVDLPLALVIALFTPVLGAAAAENLAMVAVPLATLGVILFVVAKIAARFFGRDELTFACLALGLSPGLVAQVLPMRIDHHGWQVACVMVALLGLLPGKSARGAALSGVVLAVGLTISLEPMPLLAGFGLVFGLRWLLAGDRKSLSAFLGALALAAGALFAATRGFGDLAVHCDSLSPPYLLLLAVTAGVTLAVAALAPRAPALRLGLLGLAAGAGVAAFLAVAPQCTSGPFAALDPLVRHYWYDNVLEGLPLWALPPLQAIPAALAGLIALGVLVHLARSASGDARQWWSEYALVMAVAWVAGLMVFRSQGFVGALAGVPLGWLAARLFQRMRHATNVRAKLGAGLAAVLVLMPGFPTALAGAVLPKGTVETGEMAKISDSRCDLTRNARRLDTLAPATILAPLDLGPALVEQSHHAVVATGHHRAADAMHDSIATFLAPEAEARALIAKRGVGYVLVCDDLAEPWLLARDAPNGLAARLVKGRAPGWLEPVDVGAPPAFRLWRVKP